MKKKFVHIAILLFLITATSFVTTAQTSPYSNYKIISYFDYVSCSNTNNSSDWNFTTNCGNNCATWEVNTNPVHKKEGLGSYKVDYTFTDIGETVTFSKSFGFYTQDYSFNSYGLRLWVKGGENNTDNLRIVLFEDTNMDNAGYYNEEIYEYNNGTALSNAIGGYIDIPFSSFTKFCCTGNGLLDTDRIGIIWISVISNSTTTHSRTIYIDELSWTLNNIPPQQGNAYLQGTFLPLHAFDMAMLNWTSEQWGNEIQRMKNLNMHYLVVQFSQVFNLNNPTSGHSYYLPTNSYGMNPWNNLLYSSPIDSIMKAAKNQQFKVYLGLNLDGNYWYNNIASYNQTSFYDTLYHRQQIVVDELYDKFASNPALEGWYIPQEFYNVWFLQQYKEPLAIHYRDIASYCKSKNNAKKVLIAPFFMSGVPTDALESWYNSFFATVNNAGSINIDYCYVQDAVGQNHNKSGVEISQFLPHIKNACDNNGITLGVTIESFLQPQSCPIDSLNWANGINTMSYRYFSHHDTIPFGLKHQLWEACQFTPNLVNFSWFNFHSQNPDQTLYNTYHQYIINTQSPIVGTNSSCIGNSNTYSVPFSPNIQYLWNVPANLGSIISGGTQNNNTITIQWNNNGMGVIGLERISE